MDRVCFRRTAWTITEGFAHSSVKRIAELPTRAIDVLFSIQNGLCTGSNWRYIKFHIITIGFQLKMKKRSWIPTDTRQHSWIPKATPNRRLDSKSNRQHSWIPKAPPNRRFDSKSKRRQHQDACWIPTKLLVLDWIPNRPPFLLVPMFGFQRSY